MVLASDDRPVVVVEAKSLRVPPQYDSVLREQANMYATETGTPWAVVVDPACVRVFKAGDGATPVGTLSTEEVLRTTFPGREPSAVGEHVLLLAVSRWLPGLARDEGFIKKYPALREFANDCSKTVVLTSR